MSPASGTDTCRITVVGPRRRVDLALPVYVSFADLFPTVAKYAGLDQPPARQEAGGWVMQRLGQAPFAPDATPFQAGLRDGELVYLYPRRAQLPEFAFDDVADVIASGIGERPGRWGAIETRRVALGAAATALLAGAAALALSGPPWSTPAIACAAIAVVLLAAAAAVSRAAGDAGAGAVLGYVALPFAFLAGLTGPAGSMTLGHLGALELLSGFGAVLLAATLAAAVIAEGVPVFLGSAGAALLAAGAAWADDAFSRVGLPGAAAVAAGVALAFTPLIPTIAFRAARVTLPPVPRDADELRQETLAVQGKETLERTAAADRVVTGAVSGIGMLGGLAELTLAFDHGWLARLMCGVLGCALLLRSRVVRGRAQRLWLQIPGYGGLALLAVGSSLVLPQARTLAIVLPVLLVGAAILTGVGTWLPSHRPSPFWARAGEVVDMMLIVSLIPLALGVAGLYSYIRGLSG
ncbi:MAG TPA: type VII secretion integral membrane protein EccD [Streptosporangiaceae bacterium]|jgi:type VII secretion integral membrane protein EccD